MRLRHMDRVRYEPRVAPAFKLFFFDVDGTLLTSDRRLTDRTRAALREAKRQGVGLSLATGRTYESARPYAELIEADRPLVLYNGARVQAPAGGAVLREWRLTVDQARVALEAARGWDVHTNLYQQDAIYISEWTERARDSAQKDGVEFVVAKELTDRLDRPPLKIMFIGEPHVVQKLREHLVESFAAESVPLPSAVHSETTYLELWNPAASKGVAAGWVLEHLGLSSTEVAAFGDGLNDLELVRLAGFGVAMKNAPAELKAHAKRIAPSNEEEGVAAVLEELLSG